MDNYQIADAFSLLGKLMDIHGENSFKAKAYSSAAFAIEKLTLPLSETPREKIAGIKGIGDSAAKKIIELLDTGKLDALNTIIANTPPGILEMLNIKGIGPKKIATIWKEMEIESIGELLYACKENRLKLYKGFGEKTQQNVIETIEFYQKNQGSHLYAQIEPLVPVVLHHLSQLTGDVAMAVTGAFKRQVEIIDALELVIDTTTTALQQLLAEQPEFKYVSATEDALIYQLSAGLMVQIYTCDRVPFVVRCFETTGTTAFTTAFEAAYPNVLSAAQNEAQVFETAGLPYIPACLREEAGILAKAQTGGLATPLIRQEDIRGIIHSHSQWSDGTHTLEAMAKGAKAKGLEYLVISDHSKSAFYAQGLSEERIREQHRQIDELNAQLAPFKIFKSIECDILNDGSLDYSDNILSTFDLVITSVHSNLKMTEEKAMMRLLNAVKNPYTTILGHPTGRLLLSRKGYPVNHEQLIEACAEHQVVIELNAHPSRLDIDWRWIEKAIAAGVLLSINPDAHAIEGFEDTRYGVLVAQKAGLTPAQNLSSMGLADFENWLTAHRQQKRNARHF
jgi:DNA polymerase (family X)